MSSKVLPTNGSKVRLETKKPALTSSRPTNQPNISTSRPTSNTTHSSGKIEGGSAGRKRKRPGPFRVKVGCIVAQRIRPDGNTVSVLSPDQPPRPLSLDDFCSVWTSPLAGRDEGLALIGKRVRCFFPKMEGLKKRVLEGEVCGLLNYPKQQEDGTLPLKVELLIDKSELEHFGFLPRCEDDVDPSKLPNETAKKNYRLEESIRGKNKTTVKVKLSSLVSTSEAGLKWAIYKRVPSRLFHTKPARNNLNEKTSMEGGTNAGELAASSIGATKTQVGGDSVEPVIASDANGKTTTSSTNGSNKRRKSTNGTAIIVKHVGDGRDSPEQQVNNWRWVAGRYHDMLLSSQHDVVDSMGLEMMSAGFVGEVVKVEASSGGSTLANVTVRRLFLPEHTASGRQRFHGSMEAFSDYDLMCSGEQEQLLQVPVEELIIVSKKILRAPDEASADADVEQMSLSHMYSLRKDLYMALSRGSSEADEAANPNEASMTANCHRCRRSIQDDGVRSCSSTECPSRRLGSTLATSWCSVCAQALPCPDGSADGLPCCRGICDCRNCCELDEADRHEAFEAAVADSLLTTQQPTNKTAFESAITVMQSLDTVEFGLPRDTLCIHTISLPSTKPSTRIKSKSPKKPKKLSPARSDKTGTKKKTDRKSLGGKSPSKPELAGPEPPPREDYSVFKPTCARSLVYDPSKKDANRLATLSSPKTADKPRNLRNTMVERSSTEEDKTTTSSSRAARANQRRFMKDVTALGAASFEIDTLASREPQLRFDRSGIHAWGVFADEDIAAGEMIIEYRGELIGNAMAEKREKEYEIAKIGSDYMFRVDSLNVCDATKQGNVARFINASCEPNCYTKIITLDGNKRIVIYSKRDIREGEELSYDYKFPLEYDETQRIPCHCGTRECRGFMNWDKRYVAINGSPGALKQVEKPIV